MFVLSTTKKIQIRCVHCKHWFDSPIFIGGSDSFDISIITGNTVDCPKCRRITGCNKENMRVLFEDGGYRGLDTFN